MRREFRTTIRYGVMFLALFGADFQSLSAM